MNSFMVVLGFKPVIFGTIAQQCKVEQRRPLSYRNNPKKFAHIYRRVHHTLQDSRFITVSQH